METIDVNAIIDPVNLRILADYTITPLLFFKEHILLEIALGFLGSLVILFKKKIKLR